MKKSITTRFLINGVGFVTVLLLLLSLVFFLFVRSFYYHNVENSLVSYANTSFDLFSRYLADEGYDIEAGSRDFVENFRDKELVELQLLDESGTVIMSTSGFLPEEDERTDWQQALQEGGAVHIWRGDSVYGEQVMSACVVLMRGNQVHGGLRYISSLQQVDRRLSGVVVLLVLLVLVVLTFILLSSFYFVGTILNPVRELGATARRIATGDYEVRIEKRYDDEIGDLCDTINYMAGEIANTERIKNEFISSVSHELRTPLTAIKGWSETVRDFGRDDPALQQKGLTIISSEAERLSGIVEELLDFSRMQSGRLTMRMEKMDVLAELEETVVLFRERAQREGLTLQYVEPASLPPIVGDKDRLRQVFINILDNAIKYTPTGGTIRVEAADMRVALQIVISDNGIGIPAADLPLIKDKFYRVNKSGAIPGSGIGLALADEIVQFHGGTLEIESTEHVGTSVIITLPSCSEDATPSDI